MYMLFVRVISPCSSKISKKDLSIECCLLTVLSSAWIMHLGSHPSVKGACCLDIGFPHMFSALACVALIDVHTCGQVLTVRLY